MTFKVGAASAKATADAYYDSAGADATQVARDEIQEKIRSSSKNGRYSATFTKRENPNFFSAYLTLKTELENVGYTVSMMGDTITLSWS